MAMLANPAAALRAAGCDTVTETVAESPLPSLGAHHSRPPSPASDTQHQSRDADCGHSMPASNCAPGVGCLAASPGDVMPSVAVLAASDAAFLPPGNGPAANGAAPDTPPPRT